MAVPCSVSFSSKPIFKYKSNKILWCQSNTEPFLPSDRAHWSQRFCPYSCRVVALIGGFRGTAAFLPTALSSVSSIQVTWIMIVCLLLTLNISPLCVKVLFCCQQIKSSWAGVSMCLQAREQNTGRERMCCKCERVKGNDCLKDELQKGELCPHRGYLSLCVYIYILLKHCWKGRVLFFVNNITLLGYIVFWGSHDYLA